MIKDLSKCLRSKFITTSIAYNMLLLNNNHICQKTLILPFFKNDQSNNETWAFFTDVLLIQVSAVSKCYHYIGQIIAFRNFENYGSIESMKKSISLFNYIKMINYRKIIKMNRLGHNLIGCRFNSIQL